MALEVDNVAMRLNVRAPTHRAGPLGDRGDLATVTIASEGEPIPGALAPSRKQMKALAHLGSARYIQGGLPARSTMS